MIKWLPVTLVFVERTDKAVVYAIASKHGEKGVLVNGFGISTDAVSDDMIEKLKVNVKMN